MMPTINVFLIDKRAVCFSNRNIETDIDSVILLLSAVHGIYKAHLVNWELHGNDLRVYQSLGLSTLPVSHGFELSWGRGTFFDE